MVHHYQVLKVNFICLFQSPEFCPNDNLNDDIAVEYVFLKDETEDAAKLLPFMNDGKNTENKKLTLMNYKKKFMVILILDKIHKSYDGYEVFGKKK